MPITFRCKSCHTGYSVKDTLAGRMAECKHCGQRFQIPYRSPVVKLDDDMVQDEPPAAEPAGARTHAARKAGALPLDGDEAGRTHAGGQPAVRSFAEYEPLRKPGKRKPKPEEAPEETFAPLPSILTDVWLPIALCVIFYGASVYIALGYIFRSYGVGAGLVMAAMTALIYWAAIIPLTVRVVEGAADSFGFKPSNALFLQVSAALSLPAYGILLGLLRSGGLHGAVAGGLVTGAFAILALAVMFQTSVGKGIQTAVLAAIGFFASAGVTTLLVWLVSVNLIPRWGLNLPWQPPPPPDVVAQQPPAAPAPAPDAPPAAVPDGVPDSASVAAAVVATPPRAGGGGFPSAALRSGSESMRSLGARAAERVASALRSAKFPPLKPRPRPQLPLEALAKQKQWTFTVTAVQRAEVGGEEEIQELRRQQADAQKAARTARARAIEMESEKVRERTRDALGNTRVVLKSQYSKSAIGAARVEAMRAESQAQALGRRVAKLERDRQDAGARRVVIGKLDDGRVVQIEADGGRLAALADGMQPSSVWQVKGVGRVEGAALAVKPSAFSPPEATPKAAEAAEAAEASAVVKPLPPPAAPR